MPLRFGVGYSLLPEGRVCAWGGTGGSTVIIDLDRRTVAYVMSKMAPEDLQNRSASTYSVHSF